MHLTYRDARGSNEGDIAHVARASAIDRLAKTLAAEMEGLDPTEDWDSSLTTDENWALVDDRYKEFYRLSVEALLSHDDWVRAALRS